ncbi:50S ribosomal protein L17 [Candidatus Magnetaquicoccaceae bacterium FCR-1]|uniref:Large ribosomal subunit protein bL17 n=1 Tax=Candidatus Magnetaquiglobus chichijimensis TaxID=3141448 RepID=A0ABQ0CAS1_9PROT
MRHLKQGRKLNRRPDIRNALLRNMLTSLFRYERIEVTVPRAKELRMLADKLVTLGKDGSLHARRQALSVMTDKEVTHKLFSDIAERNKERNGGYTRIIKTRHRYGDCAPMAFIELVEREAAV